MHVCRIFFSPVGRSYEEEPSYVVTRNAATADRLPMGVFGEDRKSHSPAGSSGLMWIADNDEKVRPNGANRSGIY